MIYLKCQKTHLSVILVAHTRLLLPVLHVWDTRITRTPVLPRPTCHVPRLPHVCRRGIHAGYTLVGDTCTALNRMATTSAEMSLHMCHTHTLPLVPHWKATLCHGAWLVQKADSDGSRNAPKRSQTCPAAVAMGICDMREQRCGRSQTSNSRVAIRCSSGVHYCRYPSL